jgi:hypothetical protein
MNERKLMSLAISDEIQAQKERAAKELLPPLYSPVHPTKVFVFHYQ